MVRIRELAFGDYSLQVGSIGEKNFKAKLLEQAGRVRTLAISLNTEFCAWSNSLATSSKLLTIASSSPTARVIRAARAVRKLWSMFSSHGEPGAKKAL